jgi:thiamine pyrophosphate-dependent acetolactate synthase large subunit-like protein
MLNDQDRQSEYVGMDFANPLDLAAIGQAMGVAGERVEDPQMLASVVERCFASGKPAVIDVSIDGSL